MSTSQEEGRALLFTMKQLMDDPATAIDTANAEDRPVFVTRHGRFIAVILPLNVDGIESEIVAEAIEKGILEVAHGVDLTCVPVDDLLTELEREDEPTG